MKRRPFAIPYLPFVILASFFLACAHPAGVGIGGRYLDARAEVTRPVGNTQVAIEKLEEVVRQDPLYRDSLTLLGRAYYKSGRYQDAFQILKRALAVNQRDEIAWISLGLAQLRLGDDAGGLESLKGGITLLAREARDGYRGIEFWDKNGLVRSAIRRAAFSITKGLEVKAEILRNTETLLVRIDDEARLGKREEMQEWIMRD